MGGMTIRFFRTNPLMKMGEKSNGNGVEAIGALSPLSDEITVLGSGVGGRRPYSLSDPNRNPISWFGSPSRSLRVRLVKM
jgi:hypothetical protein